MTARRANPLLVALVAGRSFAPRAAQGYVEGGYRVTEVVGPSRVGPAASRVYP